ncbi:transposase [Rhizobium sp. BR 314]
MWILRSGARWCDLPERYGKWKTVRKRFSVGVMPVYGNGCSRR